MARNNPVTRARHKKALEAFNGNRLDEAREIYLGITRKDRLDDLAWAMLGVAHALLNDLVFAESCLQRAADLNPSNFDALYNLGRAQYGLKRWEVAILNYQKALCIKPEHGDTLMGLGLSFAAMGQWIRAQAFYEQILKHYPMHAAAMDNLAGVLRNQGRVEQALFYYRRAVAANPTSATYSNLLLCLHYPATFDAVTVFHEHLAWGKQQVRGGVQQSFILVNRDPDRKLRIGYVTPDLRCHSVAYFIEPLLVQHDRARFEMFSYLELGEVDDTTQRLLPFAGVSRNTYGRSDDDVAEIIRHDEIDILIDLAGHTNRNRLPVFARKPAPIQITYLGYPNTSGLPNIDYRLTDAWADPPGMTDHLYTEKLIRLENGFLCYQPPAESPAVTQPPSLVRKGVTYGSFNALPKITEEIVKVWARILSRVPDSRLLIKNSQLSDLSLRAGLLGLFEQYGVDKGRIDLMGQTSKDEHMATYAQVDIALDTFPYHGTTTTCDTLWMGVPVITRAGEAHVSRVGVSLLTRIGLPNLIAESYSDYVDTAVKLAGQTGELCRLRLGLREMIERSGLCDGSLFAREVENVYGQLWQDWCRSEV